MLVPKLELGNQIEFRKFYQISPQVSWWMRYHSPLSTQANSFFQVQEIDGG